MKFINGRIGYKKIYTIHIGQFMVTFYRYRSGVEFLLWGFEPCYRIVLGWISFTYWNKNWPQNKKRINNE